MKRCEGSKGIAIEFHETFARFRCIILRNLAKVSVVAARLPWLPTSHDNAGCALWLVSIADPHDYLAVDNPAHFRLQTNYIYPSDNLDPHSWQWIMTSGSVGLFDKLFICRDQDGVLDNRGGKNYGVRNADSH